MGASGGSLGIARAQTHLRQILVTLDMPTLSHPERIISNAEQDLSRDGKLTKESTRCFIQELLAALVSLVETHRAAAGVGVKEAA